MKRSLGLSLALLSLAALALPATVPAAIGLPEKSVEALLFLRHPRGLNRFVRAVSDPASPRYRQYANVATLVKRFGASRADQRQTLAWLQRRGLHGTVGPTGAYVTVPITPGRADRLLPRPAGAGALTGGTLGREVPAALRGPVRSIGTLGNQRVFKNLTAAPSAAAPEPAGSYSSILPHSGTASGCRDGRNAGFGAPLEPFTPNQYLSAYGHAAMHARGLRGQGESMAVVEIDGFRHSDIETFDRCFGLRTPPIRVVPVSPLKKPFPPGTETTLDLEVLSAGVPDVDRIDVYEEYGTETGIMLAAGSALGSPGHRPDVISISLGICEPRYSGHLVLYRAMNSIFAVAAGAGISTLVAAGDTGSSGCRVETKATSTALPVKAVSLPSSSPYVTAVGGTNLLLTAKNRIRSEIVWNDWPELPGGGWPATRAAALSPTSPPSPTSSPAMPTTARRPNAPSSPSRCRDGPRSAAPAPRRR
jgi:subtilase family serine protease